MFERMAGALRFSALLVVLIMCLSIAQVSRLAGGETDEVYDTRATDSYVQVGWMGTIYSWNPLNPMLPEDYVACSLVHSSLFTYDQDWNGPIYDLATDCLQTVEANGTMTTLIDITQNAYFRSIADPEDASHPLTAEDVVFTFNAILDNPGASSWGAGMYGISEVVATGDFQISITTDSVVATLLDNLACIPIVPKYVYEGSPNPFGSMNPDDLVGSGPFMFESWVKDAWYKFKSAPNYHGEADYGEARDIDIPGILYIVYSNMAPMCYDLNHGALDTAVLTGDLNAFQNAVGGPDASVNIIKQAVHENGITDIAINAIPDSFDAGGYLNRHEALEDPFVRKAIMMTLNKDYIVEDILDGLPVRACSVVQPGFWQAEIENELPFDPHGAKMMLMDNGWQDADGDGWLDAGPTTYGVVMGWFPVGTELSGIRCQAVDTDSNLINIAMAWPGWAAQAGIQLLASQESETVMVNEAWYAADYDIWIWSWNWGPEPLEGALSVWLTSEIGKGGDNCQMPMGPWWYGPSNYTNAPTVWYTNGMVMEYEVTQDGYSAYDQNFSIAMGTLDIDDRKAIVDKLQQWIYDSYCENPPYYTLGLYAYTDWRLENWGDWELHPGRTTISSLPWLWFDLVSVGDNLPPVFHAPLLPSYEAIIGEETVFEVVVSDPEGDPLWINWSFGDNTTMFSEYNNGDTSIPITSTGSHTYFDLATDLELIVTVDDGVPAHQVWSVATVDVVEDQPLPRIAGYYWHDMFNVPFGEWWDWRFDYYYNWEVVSDTYPYIYRTFDDFNPSACYSSMRLNVMTDSLPEVNMDSNPQFLPQLGDEQGGTAIIDWYMQYMTAEEMDRYPDSTAAWYDGWVVSLNGTVVLDRAAAMSVMGITSQGFDDFDAWWDAYEAAFEMEYIDWLLYEGNERLDIYCAYDYSLVPLSFDIDAQKIGDKIVLAYDTVSWGMDILMTRWLRDSFMPTEWHFEDFAMHAEIFPDVADIDIDTAVVGALFAWQDTETGIPSWAWRGMLQDYVESNFAHPESDFDIYAPLDYMDMYAGSASYGQMRDFEYTPGAFNLSDGEEMWFEWPQGPQTFITNGGEEGYTMVEYEILGPYSEPARSDLPSSVVVDDDLRTLTFDGPIDVYGWSQEQVSHDYLESEWDRLGMLPYGMPWVQFMASSEPSEPAVMVIEGLPDITRVNQTVGFVVTVLDQYGQPYTDYSGTVSFSASDSYAILPDVYTFISSDAGTHYFEAILFSEGVQYITVCDSEDPALTDTAEIEVLSPVSEKQWTVLVYLDADNNLEPVGLADFLEMATVGSSDDVNILVQFDRISSYDSGYGDWTDTKRFYVTQGMTPYSYNAVEDLGELNMGDPATLSDFISWGVTNYPAEEIMLVLWDHGGGWDGAVCWDDTNAYDALTMDEVEIALADAQLSTGKKIDVLGYDACLMAMAEVIYETKEYVDYVVASEEMVPIDGWPYDTIMSDLVGDPLMTPAELSSCIVSRYMEFYGTEGIETISAVDVAAADDMYAILEVFAQELINILPEHKDVIEYCRMNSTVFSGSPYMDLYDFAFEVGDYYTTADMIEAADALWAAVSAAVIAEGHADIYWDSHGISIYFPVSYSSYWPEYETVLDFTNDTLWDEFLVQYLTVGPDGYEPDDMYTDATELLPDVTQTHNLHLQDDVDWYFFTLTEEDDVRIRTEGSYGQWGYTYMMLFDEAGVPEYPIAIDENWGYDYWASIDIYLVPGTYYAMVGSYEEIDSYDITLTVGSVPNDPPVPIISIDPYPFLGVEAIFDASYSYDPDGWIVSYFWDFGDGATSDEVWVNHTYYDEGDYEVTLTVTDNEGASVSSIAYISVFVNLEPVPILSFSPAAPQPGETVYFDAGDSYDPDGSIVYYYFDFGDDSYQWTSSPQVQHTYYSEGQYTVTLSVYDQYWVFSSTSIVVGVGLEPVPPVAIVAYEPSLPVVGDPVTFDASNSFDPDGDIIAYVWQFGDGDVAEGMIVTHVYEHEGVFEVQLTVMDGDLLVGVNFVNVTVASVPMPAMVWSPLEPKVGELVTFYAYGSYDEGGIVEYAWSFGDGIYAIGWEVTHTYSERGDYEVTLTVTNIYGIQASVTQTIDVGKGGGGVKGSVHSQNNKPVSGAVVELRSMDGVLVASTLTDGAGDYGMVNLAPGTYQLTISKDGYADVSTTVTIGDEVIDVETEAISEVKLAKTLAVADDSTMHLTSLATMLGLVLLVAAAVLKKKSTPT